MDNIKNSLFGLNVVNRSTPFNGKKREDFSDENMPIEINSKKVCVCLSQPTISDLVKLIQLHDLTKLFIEELQKFEKIRQLVEKIKVSLSNTLEPEKTLLTICLEDIFNKENIHAFAEIKELFDLLCWAHIYKCGNLPDDDDQNLLEFLGCKNFFELILFTDFSEKISTRDHLDIEGLNRLMNQSSDRDSPFKALRGSIIDNFKSIFVFECNIPSTNVIYNFFKEQMTLGGCEKWILDLFGNKESVARNLSLYIKVLSNSKSKSSKILPDFSCITHEEVRLLIQNIESQARGLPINLPKDYVSENSYLDDSCESTEEVEKQDCDKVIFISSPSIDSLLDLIELHDMVTPFLDEIKTTRKYHINYQELTNENIINPPSKRQLLKIFFISIFGSNPEYSQECRLLIDLLCWNHLFEKGHLPGNDNNQLLEFLGVKNFFELICPPSDSSKLEKNPEHTYTDFRTLRKFMKGLEHPSDPIVQKFVKNPLIKCFLQQILSCRFIQKFRYDHIAKCEKIIHQFFNKSIPLSQCEALVNYMFNLNGNQWLGKRPHYLALYIRILTSNNLTKILPQEIPKTNLIENKGACILVERIEKYIRQEKKEIEKDEKILEDDWKPFPDFDSEDSTEVY